MIAPLKEPPQRAGRRRLSPGVARAHRWISKTLFVDGPTTKERSGEAVRRWLIVGWLVLTASFFFGKLLAGLLAR